MQKNALMRIVPTPSPYRGGYYELKRKPTKLLLVLSMLGLVILSVMLLAWALARWRNTTQILKPGNDFVNSTYSTIPFRYGLDVQTF